MNNNNMMNQGGPPPRPPKLIPEGTKTVIQILKQGGGAFRFHSPLDYAMAVSKLKKDQESAAIGEYEILDNKNTALDPTGKTVRREYLFVDFNSVTDFVVAEVAANNLLVPTGIEM